MYMRQIGFWITFVTCMLTASTIVLAAPSPYEFKAGSPDGIGKFYFNREIAHVMGYEGADWLERPTREQEERPDLLVKELHLTAGMTIAEFGAGSGYLRLARVSWSTGVPASLGSTPNPTSSVRVSPSRDRKSVV